jgi:hypothetical protein
MNFINEMLVTRRNELLDELLEDAEYIKLRDISAESSMAVKRAVSDTAADELFEQYCDDNIRKQIYELDFFYKKALDDALGAVK